MGTYILDPGLTCLTRSVKRRVIKPAWRSQVCMEVLEEASDPSVLLVTSESPDSVPTARLRPKNRVAPGPGTSRCFRAVDRVGEPIKIARLLHPLDPNNLRPLGIDRVGVGVDDECQVRGQGRAFPACSMQLFTEVWRGDCATSAFSRKWEKRSRREREHRTLHRE
jgi:hypothetical protein